MNDIILVYLIIGVMAFIVSGIIFFTRLHHIHNQFFKYRQKFRYFPTPKLFVNANGIIYDATHSAASLFGYNDLKNFLFLSIHDFFPALYSIDDSFIEIDTHCILKINGNDKLLHIRAFAMDDNESIWIIEDLSYIEEQEKKFNSVSRAIENAHDGIALMDNNGKLIFANKSLWSIYNISPECRADYLNQNWIKLYSLKGQEVLINDIIPHVNKHKSWSGATWIKSTTGQKFYADLSLQKTNDGYLGIVRDRTDFITEREVFEKTQADLFAAQKNNSISRIMRGLIHDFNNTISVIMGHSELLLEHTEKNDDIKQSLELIVTASQKARAMLGRVRELIPIDTVNALDTDEFNIAAMFDSVIKEHSNIISYNSILSASVKGKGENFADKFHHLIQNAKESSKESRNLIAVSLHHETQKQYYNVSTPKIIKISDTISEFYFGITNAECNYITISVHDLGSGMEHDVLSHASELFFTTKGKHHSGLGLPMIMNFVKDMGGIIVIRSEVGVGTSVSLSIPIIQGSTIWPQDHNTLGLNFMNVINNEHLINPLVTLLESQGHRIFSFSCPLDAMDALRESREEYDIILVHSQLKPIDGRSFISEIKKDFVDIPVILIEEQNSLEKGHEADEAITSPINMALFNQKLEKIINA
jgi:signal transduction histidine kinase/CheY-like chemotaxis protein